MHTEKSGSKFYSFRRVNSGSTPDIHPKCKIFGELILLQFGGSILVTEHMARTDLGDKFVGNFQFIITK